MVLCVGPTNGLLENVSKVVSVKLACRFVELHRDEVHKVLNKVALAQQQVLSDGLTVVEELMLLKHDLNEFLVCLKGSLVDPLSHEFKVKSIIRPVHQLKRLVQNPVFLLAASSNEVHCFPCLQDLVQLLCQEGWDGMLDDVILIGPKPFIRY